MTGQSVNCIFNMFKALIFKKFQLSITFFKTIFEKNINKNSISAKNILVTRKQITMFLVKQPFSITEQLSERNLCKTAVLCSA